jgi:hypothetical protein
MLQESFVFWPLNGAVLNMAQFKVTLTEEQHQSNHVVRDFILQSLQVCVVIFYVIAWLIAVV